ncbi:MULTISPECIES: class F sortase [unclassified Streptomyces]|uniref:class F sortase n=1 Tax=unclassified Streptomyces TaxID=2593676 RepID=UPI001BE9F3CD|nr:MULTISPECIES: class F sortase [unclassified Streptomyces]MBT2402629.1 class F sortase [Streptomyces sp. ISL-21]MBT2457228.1 class F sortase [Streptomyces sp. ISL-86]MBT2608022.1 class F sortase [Streptomyces sp. ISL-87]
MTAPDEPRSSAGARLLTFAAWSVLVLGLWLWGREITGVPAPVPGQGGAAVGLGLPVAHAPLSGAPPARVDVPSIGVQAPVIPRGLDADGAIEPPPYDRPGTVGWWGGGAQPGEAGTALLVGHVDTASKPAVFYGLSSAQQGDKVRVVRADGTIAEFTIEDVRVYERAGFDAHKAYGPRVRGRAELRLVTCGGAYDKKAKQYTANVVVSAYLTGEGVRSGTAA